MDSQLFSGLVLSILLVTISALVTYHLYGSLKPHAGETNNMMGSLAASPERSKLIHDLASALPDSIILPHDEASFRDSMKSYWARQASEVAPACVIQPRGTQQLSEAVKILKHEFDGTTKHSGDADKVEGLFAVRGGGHSPLPRASSTDGGILIDLCSFCEVTPSEDGSSIVIGAGAKWSNVSRILDEKGLAVVGGRNSAVGVGGLTLGGGLSFFSPRFGLVCSNIISYEVVLASGSIAIASASVNPDLWRALKGGSNNFAIVTRFTARAFPSTKIWSGFLYMHSSSSQVAKVLDAFQESVSRTDPNDSTSPFDSHAAGPLACFSYIQQIRIQAISVNLVYTKDGGQSSGLRKNKWPQYWKTSRFSSLWRIWSTLKYQTLTSATDEMDTLNPPGRRQVFATTTIKNDLTTLAASHSAYSEAIAPLRNAHVKGLVWTLVLQPLLPFWARKGDANPLGLDKGSNAPLVIIMFTVNWDEGHDDEFVKTALRQTMEKIDDAARARKTDHPYRYLNNCAEWQRPFEGYGQENVQFLQNVSKTYDPDGLFQKGCVGGFKLNVEDYQA